MENIVKNAENFLKKCEDCIFSQGNNPPRCDFLVDTTPADYVSAASGAAQTRPPSRNYCARVVIKFQRLLSAEGFKNWFGRSSWAETAKNLNVPCEKFKTKKEKEGD